MARWPACQRVFNPARPVVPEPAGRPPGFFEEWRRADGAGKAMAVLKRLAPALLFVVFMYFFTTFAGR